MNGKRWLTLGSLLLVVVLVLAACGATATPTAVPTKAATTAPTSAPTTAPTAAATAAPTKAPTAVPPTATKAPAVGGTVTWAFVEPDTLDPHKTGLNFLGSSLMGASLLSYGPDGKFYGYLAESWTISTDGLTWDFKLKKGIKFHDGTPMTAQDIVWTYNRAKDPATKSPIAGTMLAVVGSLEAIDELTVRMRLPKPSAPLMVMLSNVQYMTPLSKAAVEKAGDQAGRSLLSVGPYKFVEWKTGDRLVIQRNPDFGWGPSYYHQGARYIDTYVFRLITEEATIVAGIEAGELDGAIIPAKDVKRIKDAGKYQVFDSVTPGLRPWVVVNMTLDMFKDVKVRQAMNCAIDRDAAILAVMGGAGVPQYGPLSSTVPGYWPDGEKLGYRYDLAKAKDLMKQAGYTAGADGVLQKDGKPWKFAIKAAAVLSFDKLAEVLQQQWKALGADVSIQLADVGAYTADLYGGKYEVGITGAGYYDADLLYLLFHSSMIGGLNMGRVSDPDLDKLLDQSRVTMDPAKRQLILNDVQKMIIEKAYTVPVYATVMYTAVSNRLKGVVFSKVTGGLFLDDAYVEAK